MKNIVRRFFQYFWLFILFVAAIFIAGKFCGGYNIIIKSLPQILIISVIAAVLGEWGCEMLEGVKHFYAENKRFLLTIFSFAILGIISYCTLDIYKVVQVLFFKVAFLLIGAITVLLIILVMIKFVFPVPVETEEVDSLVCKYKRIRRIALWFIIPFALMIILYGIMYIKKPNNIVSYLWMFDGVCYFCIESLPGSIKIKRFSKKK